MKLTLWQQFSSNHSGWYTIMGRFKSSKEAQEVGQTLWQFVLESVEWGRQPRTSSERVLSKLSPMEDLYTRTYGLTWESGIDWLRDFPDHLYPPKQDDHVIVFEDLVFVNSLSIMTFQAGKQFADLIHAMGGEAYSDFAFAYDEDIPSGDFSFTINCTAPDEQTADSFCNQHVNPKKPITRTGLTLHLDRWPYEGDFMSIMRELHTQGFTDITYSFAQIDLYGDDSEADSGKEGA